MGSDNFKQITQREQGTIIREETIEMAEHTRSGTPSVMAAWYAKPLSLRSLDDLNTIFYKK